MYMNRLSFKLPGQRLFLGLFLLCLALLGTKVAYADPHAVFYTATGQEQLFFNVLAALNQADFVEPAVPQTGTPAGQSGADLLEKRSIAGFPAESDPQVKATETELSAVLTRNITLEGNDVWTAYVAIQKAVDTERAVVSAQLTQQYCEKGLGEKDCQNTIAAKKNQDKAFVTDPSKYENLSLVNGALSVLKSGLPEHDQALEQALTDNSGPLANDQNIADLRANNQNDPNKKPDLIGARLPRPALPAFGALSQDGSGRGPPPNAKAPARPD